MIERFMQQLSEEMELKTPLEPKERGVYAIPFDEGLNIEASTIPDGYMLRCLIPTPLKVTADDPYTEMLFANLFFRGTGGCTLGLNESGDQITLTKTLEANADYRLFRDTVEDFLNSVDFWRAEALNYK